MAALEQKAADGQTFRGLPKTPEGNLDLEAILGPPPPRESSEPVFEDSVHHFPWNEPGHRYKVESTPIPEPPSLIERFHQVAEHFAPSQKAS